MDWLTNVKSFIEVVEQQSFSKTAEKHFTSAAAISRRISWLEQELGVKLIRRTTRVMQLTEEGKFFYERSKHWLANLSETMAQLKTQQQHLKGPLKITLPYSFSEAAITSKLMAKFSQQYPFIELILDFSNQVTDLIADEIDIAFRQTPYRSVDYHSIPVTTLKIGLFAAPHYLAQHGTPQNIAELAHHNCLLHYNMGYNTWELKDGKKQSVSGTIKTNATRALIEFAKSGIGIVRTFENYVYDEIRNQTLQAVLPEHWPEPVQIYLVYRTHSMAPLRIKAFIDFIKHKPIADYLN